MSGKVLQIKSSTKRNSDRQLKQIKKTLKSKYGIDLDRLLVFQEEAKNMLLYSEFEELIRSIYKTIDDFAEEHPQLTMGQVLDALAIIYSEIAIDVEMPESE